MPLVIDDRKCYVYRVHHKELDLSYLGISVNPERRMETHRAEAVRGKHTCRKFYNALRKYGCDSFTWEVVAIGHNWEAGGKLEQLGIATGLGNLNLTRGGEGVPGRKVYEACRDSLIARNKTRVWTAEAREKIAAKLRGRKLGPRTQEVRDKVAKGHLGKPKPKFSVERKLQHARTMRKRYADAEAKNTTNGGYTRETFRTTFLEQRARLGLTYAEIGQILGLTEPAVGTWGTGKRAPKPEHRKAVIDRLLAL